MIDIMITRLIAAAVAAFLLGWACYVSAFVKHKNEIKDEANKILLEGSQLYNEEKIRIEKTKTWYIGYRLALVGLIIVAAAIGWAAAYLASGEYALSWVEDGAVAAAAAVIGGMILDKFIIHPIADGKFFEKVEDPMVQYFLENGSLPVEEVKEKKTKKIKLKKEPAVESKPEENSGLESEVLGMSFDEKVKLLDLIKKNL